MANIHANISFGLVNIPILMTKVVTNNDTSFNQLHKKCLKKVKYLKYCEHCKKELKESDIIKGYEYNKNDFIVFDKNELDNLKPENDHEIEVISFIDEKEVSTLYFEKSYFLISDNKSKAYNLFINALKVSKKVALAKCVLNSKFYYAILKVTELGLILTTLFFEEELNIPTFTFPEKLENKELELALKLIDNMQGKFTPEKYKDEYQENIKKAINTKMNGKKIKNTKKSNRTQIENLMEALERSLKN